MKITTYECDHCGSPHDKYCIKLKDGRVVSLYVCNETTSLDLCRECIEEVLKEIVKD